MLKSILKSQKSAALLEFVAVLPILMILFFAVFVVGYWMNLNLVTTIAAHAGAKLGAEIFDLRKASGGDYLYTTNQQIEDVVKKAVAGKMSGITHITSVALPSNRPLDFQEPTNPDDSKSKQPSLCRELSVTVQSDLPFGGGILEDEFKKLPGVKNFPFKTVNVTATYTVEERNDKTNETETCTPPPKQ